MVAYSKCLTALVSSKGATASHQDDALRHGKEAMQIAGHLVQGAHKRNCTNIQNNNGQVLLTNCV